MNLCDVKPTSILFLFTETLTGNKHSKKVNETQEIVDTSEGDGTERNKTGQKNSITNNSTEITKKWKTNQWACTLSSSKMC